jgi:hypothetical protein
MAAFAGIPPRRRSAPDHANSDRAGVCSSGVGDTLMIASILELWPLFWGALQRFALGHKCKIDAILVGSGGGRVESVGGVRRNRQQSDGRWIVDLSAVFRDGWMWG